jgi:hypothetical protein
LKINEKKISLYKKNYSFSYFELEINKVSVTFVLSCRYIGNYFKVQNNEQIINVFCEDFVTCIKARNSLNKTVYNYFYTGLLNGKLIEWKIELSDIKMKNYKIKEIKHIYAHESSITAIEIYNKQNIIITAGEDKFIYIRKIFDFELLTVIDLTYSFGNSIISEMPNIFPSLIKISDLNLFYVLLYDYDSKKTYIRGYNLNGLFFAQTDPINFTNNNNSLSFNDFSFTKNGNLLVCFYNSQSINVINAWDLIPVWHRSIKYSFLNTKRNIKQIEYNSNTKEFYFLFDDTFLTQALKDEEQKLFDSF